MVRASSDKNIVILVSCTLIIHRVRACCSDKRHEYAKILETKSKSDDHDLDLKEVFAWNNVDLLICIHVPKYTYQ